VIYMTKDFIYKDSFIKTTPRECKFVQTVSM
jgi:hypothetical protein